MHGLIFAILLLVFLQHCRQASGERHIYCADHENKKLVKVKEDGTLLWECPNNNGTMFSCLRTVTFLS